MINKYHSLFIARLPIISQSQALSQLNPPKKGGRAKKSDMEIRLYLPFPVIFYSNTDITLSIEDIRTLVTAIAQETDRSFYLAQEQFLIRGFDILKTYPSKDEKKLRALAID